MNRVFPNQPEPESENEHTMGMYILKLPKDFIKGDPVSCRKAADAMQVQVSESLRQQGIPEDAIDTLATKVAEAFYNSLMEDEAPKRGTATCEVSNADFLRAQLRGQFRKN